ncbi:MAG: SDR family oxidoreductase [Rhizobiales bacterium]|nr:SDR family oxidoreductase [Hyphomicrobiales bacterium]NRB14308.1 SDR family oxidoreductase [Hyphomicrobiales bacterium]
MLVLESFSLKGKVAVVTGGAGLYGRQIVAALAEAGAETYIAARNLAALEAVAQEERENGNNVTALSLDLASDDSIEKLHSEVIERAGSCSILVNNAVARSATDGWAHDLEAYDKSLHVNASALFKITHLFAQNMIKQKSGSIINIGSMMGMVGVELANYLGTDMEANPSPIYFYEKGGMINFTRWAASVLGSDNIRVNCLSPGGYESGQPEKFIENYCARTQLGRMANDTDLKGAIVFLASDASAYLTGTNIPIDGGYTAK